MSTYLPHFCFYAYHIRFTQSSQTGAPLRPILASTGSYNHERAKWLSEILSPLREHSFNLKDTFQFIEKMKDVSLKNSFFWCSQSIYQYPATVHNPTDFGKIFSDGVETFHKLNKRRFKTLLNWAASNTTLQFGEGYYKQIDGVAMGSPIAPMMADIFMNHVLDKALEQSHESNKHTTLFQFVDDQFLLFPNEESAQQFLKL